MAAPHLVKCSHNFFRVPVGRQVIRDALRGRGWVSLTQVCGLLGHIIPPEGALRHYQEHYRKGKLSAWTPEHLACGKRSIFNNKLNLMVMHGILERQSGPGGKDPRYRLLKEASPDGKKKKPQKTRKKAR